MATLNALLKDVRACTLCAQHLPHGVRPVVQAHAGARILIAGQAPGRKVHETGIPWDDASGTRLRAWMGMDAETFYDAKQVALLPMGFCYPGKSSSGDLPPRSECAKAWRARLLAGMPDIKLTLVIGQYAIAWHLPEVSENLTQTVRNWDAHWPKALVLPHPSPRNNPWLKKNPWFEGEVVPELRRRVVGVLRG